MSTEPEYPEFMSPEHICLVLRRIDQEKNKSCNKNADFNPEIDKKIEKK